MHDVMKSLGLTQLEKALPSLNACSSGRGIRNGILSRTGSSAIAPLPSVLIIDEVGYTRLTPEQAHNFFELVTARYEQGAILLTSNTSFAEWGNLLGDEVLATALLDWLLHHAEVIPINGRSYRMKDRHIADTVGSLS